MSKWVFVLALGLSFYSCGGRQACTGITSTYTSIHANLISPQCVKCHSDMDTYSGLTGGGRVSAGNPSSSPLYVELNGGDMPKDNKQLCDADIAAVSAWIQAGAQNN